MENFLSKWTVIFGSEKKLQHLCNLQSISEKLLYLLNSNITDKCSSIDLRQDVNLAVDSLVLRSNKSKKCLDKCRSLKQEGIEAYVNKKTTEALKIFSKALRYAPPDDPISVLLYGNRSAVLFRLKMYAECIVDIERALDSSYCPEVKPKLLIRRVKSHIELKEKVQAQNQLRHLRHILQADVEDKYSVDIVYLEDTIKDLQEGVKSIAVDAIPPLYGGQSAMFSQMSSALEMREDFKYGRHIVTKEPIKRGSVLLIEEPFCSNLLPKYCDTRCHSCFNLACNPVMCDTCVDVMWCGEQCRDHDMKLHRYECGILSAFVTLGVSHMAIRSVLRVGWDFCVSSHERCGAISESNFDSRYNAVQCLISHFNDATPNDQLQYSLMGHILALLLIRHTCFAPKGERTPQSDAIKLSSILARHIAQLICNASTVTEIVAQTDTASTMVNFKSQDTGSALYPIASIINHSCQPSVVKIFYGKMLVVRANFDLAVGSQIFYCYGPCSSIMSRVERRQILRRQYFFECDCVACNDDLADLKEAQWVGVRCPRCLGVARWANEEFSLLECVSSKSTFPSSLTTLVEDCVAVNNLFEEGMHQLSERSLTAAQTALRKALVIAEEIFCERNTFLNEIRLVYLKTLILNETFDSTPTIFKSWLHFIEDKCGIYSMSACYNVLGILHVIDQLSINKTDAPEVNEIRKQIDDILLAAYGNNWRRATNYANCKLLTVAL